MVVGRAIDKNALGSVQLNASILRISPLKLIVNNPVPLPAKAKVADRLRQKLDRAYSLLENLGEPRQAIQIYDDIIKEYAHISSNDSDLRWFVAIAFHNKGVAHERLTERGQAIRAYQEVVNSFGAYGKPDSRIRKLVISAAFYGASLYEDWRHDAFAGGPVARRVFREWDEFGYKEVLRCDENFVHLFGRLSLSEPTLREHVMSAVIRQATLLEVVGRPEEALAKYDDLLSYHAGIHWFSDDGAVPDREFDDLPLQRYYAYALFNRANLLRASDRFEEAIAGYSTLIERVRESSEDELRRLGAMALFNMAESFAEAGNIEKARELYDDLVRRFGDATDPELRQQAAMALSNKAVSFASRARDEWDAGLVEDELVALFGADGDPRIQELVAGALVSKGLHVQAFGFRGEAIGIWKTVISLYGASEMPGLVDAVRRADIYLNNYYDDTRFLDWLGTAQEILERALKAKGILPREEAVGAFVRLVDRTLESTRAYAEYVIYMRQNPSHRGDWQDVQNMQSKTKNLLQDAPALLSYYLERRGVPRDLRPYLIEQFEHLVDRAKAEISLPSATASAAELSDADLAAFEAHSEAHPWKPRSGVSPSAFIESEFSEWLGRGLQRAHITRAQPKLAAAYATELRRDPSKRAKGLIEQPHKLPVGAARPVTARLVAELSDEEKLKRRAIERQNKARQRLRKRAKVQALEK